ncbi:hypothetical protein BH18ACT15_BH18ACT15_02160 [soil metagenome]
MSRALLRPRQAPVTKRYDEPIEVTSDPRDRHTPLAFAWRGCRYEIDQLLDTWREAGEWWDRARAHEREYFRVLARPAGVLATGEIDADGFMRAAGAVYDVYRDRFGGGWRLVRVWD